MFVTTAEFLPQHQAQRQATLQIISAAEAAKATTRTATVTTESAASTAAATRAAEATRLHNSAKRSRDVAVIEPLALHILDSILQIVLTESGQPIGLALLSDHSDGLARVCG